MKLLYTFLFCFVFSSSFSQKLSFNTTIGSMYTVQLNKTEHEKVIRSVIDGFNYKGGVGVGLEFKFPVYVELNWHLHYTYYHTTYYPEWTLDNGSLGVTYQHPIYSTTAGDWKLAGELEIGEEVLTKSGNTKVLSSTKKEGSETVYNLEVKELHNFLVGDQGAVAHNACVTGKLCDWMWKRKNNYGNGVKESCIEHVSKGHLHNPASRKSQFGPQIKNSDDLEEVMDKAMKEFRKNNSNSEFLPNAYPTNPNIPVKKHQIKIDLKDYPELLETASDGTKYIGTYKNANGTVIQKTTKVLVSVDNDGIMWNFFPTI